jgi:hypothetical protein
VGGWNSLLKALVVLGDLTRSCWHMCVCMCVCETEGTESRPGMPCWMLCCGPEINEPARPEIGKEFDAVSDFR